MWETEEEEELKLLDEMEAEAEIWALPPLQDDAEAEDDRVAELEEGAGFEGCRTIIVWKVLSSEPEDETDEGEKRRPPCRCKWLISFSL